MPSGLQHKTGDYPWYDNPPASAIGALLVLSSGLSGAFGIPLVRSLPVILLLFVLAVRLVAARRPVVLPPEVLPTLGLLMVMILGLPYTKTPAYGLWKTVIFGFFWVAFPVALLGVIKQQSGLFAFARGVAFGGVLYGVLLVVRVGSPFSLLANAERFFRFSLETQNPIYLGRALAISMLALTWVAAEPYFGWWRLVAIGSLPLLGGYLVATASKGPVFGFAVSSLVLGAMIGGRMGRLLVFALVAILAVAVATPYGLQVDQARTSARVVRTMSLSFEERSSSWSKAIHGFGGESAAQMLLGAGTGGFAYLDRREDVRHYPHNILLEVLYENGVAGALLLLLFLVGPLFVLRRAWVAARRDPRTRRLLGLGCALYVFALINCQVTGDLSSNEWVPVAVALLGFLCRDALSLRGRTSRACGESGLPPRPGTSPGAYPS